MYYVKSSEKFDIGYCWIKVMVTVGLQKFPPITIIHTVRSYYSTLVQARKLMLCMYVHLLVTGFKNPENFTCPPELLFVLK